MQLKKALQQSEQWMNACVATVNTLTVPSTNRSRVAAALHQLSIEHYTGIHVLARAAVPSSAFALYRPQLETYIRASWFHHCAEDTHVEELIAGGEPPQVSRLLRDLRGIDAFGGGSLDNLMKMTWRQFCDFTHGGSLQVKVRAASPHEIAQRFEGIHLAALLEASATTALLSAVGLASIAGCETTALRLQAEYMAVFAMTS